MDIEQIKRKMISFKDFHGCSFLDHEAIKNAETIEELSEIISEYHKFLEYQVVDAQNHLERFSKSLGLHEL